MTRRPTPQRDLFGAGSRTTPDARRSVPKTPMVIEPFAFSGEGCVPNDAPVPEWLRLPIDEEDDGVR